MLLTEWGLQATSNNDNSVTDSNLVGEQKHMVFQQSKHLQLLCFHLPSKNKIKEHEYDIVVKFS